MNCKHTYDEWVESFEHIQRRGKAVAKEAADYFAEYRQEQGKTSSHGTSKLKDLARRKLPGIKSDFKAYTGLIDKYRPGAYKALRECKDGLTSAQYKRLRETVDQADAQLMETRKAYDPAIKLTG